MANSALSSVSITLPSVAARPPHMNKCLSFPLCPTTHDPHEFCRCLLPLAAESLAGRRLHPSNPPTVRRLNFRNRGQATSAGVNADEIGVRSVPVRVAHELVQAGHRYLDVRTEEEFSAGHPVGAINVPYMLKVGAGMAKNPHFLEEVSSHFGKDDEIIVGCMSGKRSLMAAAVLSSSGYTGITDVAGGYSAWVQNRLPIQ